MAGRKRKVRGRPPKYVMPERIDATPEEVLLAQFRKGQPRKAEDWEYMREFRRQEEVLEPESE